MTWMHSVIMVPVKQDVTFTTLTHHNFHSSITDAAICIASPNKVSTKNHADGTMRLNNIRSMKQILKSIFGVERRQLIKSWESIAMAMSTWFKI